MNIRERTEQIERAVLAPYAAFADSTRGRLREEKKCEIRTDFQRDRDRIIHSKSFRRLKHKTQVYLAPSGDHYRTRLTHTLEASQIARTIARSLRLNEDLTEAAALGHDLGHTPFGHAGERALAAVSSFGFTHYEQSLRVVDVLENDGRGLNLTDEVRDSIVHHTKGEEAYTLEGKVVRLSDRIAYISHDIDDSLRAGIMRNEDIPLHIRRVIGNSHSERINTLIHSVIESSTEREIKLAPDVGAAFSELHEFMFENVYKNPIAKGEEGKAVLLVQTLFAAYLDNPSLIPREYGAIIENEGAERAAVDYIAAMTDHFAVEEYTRLYIPRAWEKM
ncbi:MAG: deoxyguanosinetriphosphate triphosphohydrolase [Oscillospiraceae bacterium]|nr:deoxyguanosinetriphosphate triphosphohydrolase [Oscillospiraceae bacterium]